MLRGGTPDESGVVWQRYGGVFKLLADSGSGDDARVAPEQRTEGLELFDDMLYTAAVTAGWLTCDGEELTDVDGIQVRIAVEPLNPLWKALRADPEWCGPTQSEAAHTELLKQAIAPDEQLVDLGVARASHFRASRSRTPRTIGRRRCGSAYAA